MTLRTMISSRQSERFHFSAGLVLKLPPSLEITRPDRHRRTARSRSGPGVIASQIAWATLALMTIL